MAKASDAQNPSMEQILQTIRGVISGEEHSAVQEASNDDILELTEMIGEDGAITSLKQNENTQKTTPITESPESSETPDVLANIDNALKDDSAENNTAAEVSGTDEASNIDMPIDTGTQPETQILDTKDNPLAPEDEQTVTETQTVIPETAESSVQLSEQNDNPEPSSTTPSTQTNEISQGAEETSIEPVSAPESGNQKKHHLISEQAASASTKALATLLHSLPKPKVDSPSFQSGLTLEELVIEALKPELSAWLDKNLPTLVTHIVEKEIRKLLPQPEE